MKNKKLYLWDINLSDEEQKSVSDGLVCSNEFINIDDNLATIEQRDIEEITNEIEFQNLVYIFLFMHYSFM